MNWSDMNGFVGIAVCTERVSYVVCHESGL